MKCFVAFDAFHASPKGGAGGGPSGSRDDIMEACLWLE